jgi:hypothetical protein
MYQLTVWLGRFLQMYFGDLPEKLPPFDGLRPRDLTPGQPL